MTEPSLPSPAPASPASPASPRPLARRLALGLALSVPALGLAELVLHLAFAQSAPRADDWARARPRVSALRAEADGAVVSPWWAEPHARMAYGEGVLPLRDVARADESRYAKLLEISAMGEHLPELSAWKVLREEPLGHGLSARLLENPSPAHVRFDLTDAVEAGLAQVGYATGDQLTACPFREGEPVVAPGLFGHPAMPPRRYQCGRQAWQSVAVTVQDDQRHRARRCVWSHPPPGGEVVIRFQKATLGRVLRGHMGIHWTLEREGRGAPVYLDALVDGEPAGQARHDDGQGWERFELPLGQHQGKTGSLELRIHSPDANERHICWEADSRD